MLCALPCCWVLPGHLQHPPEVLAVVQTLGRVGAALFGDYQDGAVVEGADLDPVGLQRAAGDPGQGPADVGGGLGAGVAGAAAAGRADRVFS